MPTMTFDHASRSSALLSGMPRRRAITITGSFCAKVASRSNRSHSIRSIRSCESAVISGPSAAIRREVKAAPQVRAIGCAAVVPVRAASDPRLTRTPPDALVFLCFDLPEPHARTFSQVPKNHQPQRRTTRRAYRNPPSETSRRPAPAPVRRRHRGSEQTHRRSGVAQDAARGLRSWCYQSVPKCFWPLQATLSRLQSHDQGLPTPRAACVPFS